MCLKTHIQKNKSTGRRTTGALTSPLLDLLKFIILTSSRTQRLRAESSRRRHQRATLTSASRSAGKSSAFCAGRVSGRVHVKCVTRHAPRVKQLGQGSRLMRHAWCVTPGSREMRHASRPQDTVSTQRMRHISRAKRLDSASRETRYLSRPLHASGVASSCKTCVHDVSACDAAPLELCVQTHCKTRAGVNEKSPRTSSNAAARASRSRICNAAHDASSFTQERCVDLTT